MKRIFRAVIAAPSWCPQVQSKVLLITVAGDGPYLDDFEKTSGGNEKRLVTTKTQW